MIDGISPLRSRQPLYVQAAGQIRLQIERGDLAPGAQLPIIGELQTRFGMSRATIREALDILEEEHLIERYRGRGTFVCRRLPRRRSHVLPTRWKALVESLRSIRPELVSPVRELDGSALRGTLGGDVLGPYVHFERVHRRDGEPYCLIDINIAKDVYESDADQFVARSAVLVLSERHAEAIGRARQRVTFSIADDRTARVLGIALGAPVVEILRTIAAPDNRVVFHSYARYPGEYVTIDFDFALDGGEA